MSSSCQKSPRAFFASALALGLAAWAPWVLARPILHELFEPDPAEDLVLGATSQRGGLPAAIMTQSGAVAVPEAPAEQGPIYGGAGEGRRQPVYQLDPFTAPPSRVSYDDPFRPATVPYKRLYSFDHVAPDLSLKVRAPSLVKVPVGGQAAPDEDVFFASLTVDLVPSEPVRIVSVAPGARVLKMQSDPERSIEVLEDSAENWFVQSDRGGRVHLVMQVSAQRRAFGRIGPLGNWNRLGAPEASEEVRAAAGPVLSAIRVDRTLAPSEALSRLVGYFRSFEPSSEAAKATTPRELYRELSLNRRGVCRHRAYAFVVTASALGLSSRLVHNEAHAWVEVFDGDGFVRIDLGGAALDLDMPALDPSLPLHVPPRDPFFWPPGQSGGLELGRAATRSRSAVRDGWPSASSSALEVPPAAPVQAENVTIALSLDRAQTRRGRPLQVSGVVRREGGVCASARVDLAWVQEGGAMTSLGSVATDAEGRFEGQVSVPPGTPPGDGVVRATLGSPCAR